jgi:hypothetical protein
MLCESDLWIPHKCAREISSPSATLPHANPLKRVTEKEHLKTNVKFTILGDGPKEDFATGEQQCQYR